MKSQVNLNLISRPSIVLSVVFLRRCLYQEPIPLVDGCQGLHATDGFFKIVQFY